MTRSHSAGRFQKFFAAALSFGVIVVQAVPAESTESANLSHDRDSVITPKMFGAIGDGKSHKITASELTANQNKWVGKYEPSDEWDYVGLQEAIYACFNSGTLKPNGVNAMANKPLYIPAGNYLVNKPPTITLVIGGDIYGAGRISTTITATYPGPAFQTNGCWYTQFTGIQFSGTVAHDGAVFELDGSYDGTNKQGVQGNTFKDCYFHGNNRVKCALAIVRRRGNNAQGSENLFLNCHFHSATFAAVYIADYNALQNTFIGGNIQNCLNGFYVQAGSINVDSMGFQNGFLRQIEYGGFDAVFRNSADDHSSIKNCRSESACLLSVGNKHYVVYDNNNAVNSPPNGVWKPKQTYPQGAVVSGQTKGNGDGRVYIAMNSGTSGDAEPRWSGGGFVGKGQIEAGSDQLITDISEVRPEMAQDCGVIIYSAGKNKQCTYSNLKQIVRTGVWQLGNNAETSVQSAAVRAGKMIRDGTIKWIQLEYDEAVVNGPAQITNNTFKWGRTLFKMGEIANNTFARADDLQFVEKLSAGGTDRSIFNNHLTRNGGWNTGAKPADANPPAD
jgi:hypothetical protein